MVLGKFTVPGRPTIWIPVGQGSGRVVRWCWVNFQCLLTFSPSNSDCSRARAYCACCRCRYGLVWTCFLSFIISIFFLPPSGRRPDID